MSSRTWWESVPYSCRHPHLQLPSEPKLNLNPNSDPNPTATLLHPQNPTRSQFHSTLTPMRIPPRPQFKSGEPGADHAHRYFSVFRHPSQHPAEPDPSRKPNFKLLSQLQPYIQSKRASDAPNPAPGDAPYTPALVFWAPENRFTLLGACNEVIIVSPWS